MISAGRWAIGVPATAARLLVVVVALAGMLASVGAAWAAPLRVAIDGSGSMRGYAATGALADLVESVEAAATQSGWDPNTFVFTTGKASGAQTRWVDWHAWSADPTWGDVTRLGEAFEVGGTGRALILITDNFQDPSGGGGGVGIDPLYDRLRASAVARAYLVPDLLDFRGKVDLAPGSDLPGGGSGNRGAQVLTTLKERTNRGFVTEIGLPDWIRVGRGPGFWKVPYTGRRGLAIYLLLFDPDLAKDFEEFAQQFAATRSVKPLLVRPFAGDSLDLNASQDGEPDPKALACAGIAASALPEPNLELVDLADGYSLRPLRDYYYDPRRPGRFTAAIEVIASQSHVRIHQNAANCEEAARVWVSPLVVSVANGDRGILLPAAAGVANGSVVPPRVLSPVRLSDATSGHAVLVTFDMPALVGSDVPDELIDGQVRAEFTLHFAVPSTAVGLADEVRETYFTKSAADLARIYSPRDLVQHMARESIAVEIPVVVPAEVFWRPSPEPNEPERPGPWVALAVVAAILAVAWWLLRPRGFVLPLWWTGEPHARATRVGGLLHHPDPAPKLNIGGADVVTAHRARWWGRQIEVCRDGESLGLLARGDAIELRDSPHKVEWLDRQKEKEFRDANRYNPHEP